MTFSGPDRSVWVYDSSFEPPITPICATGKNTISVTSSGENMKKVSLQRCIYLYIARGARRAPLLRVPCCACGRLRVCCVLQGRLTLVEVKPK